MGGMSVDGLVSGLSTSSLIDQLLSLERGPQNRLRSRQADMRNTVQNFTDLSDLFKKIKTAADALDTASDWQARKATSTDEDIVSVSTKGTATPGTIGFTVTQLAATHTLISDTTVAGTDAVVADGSDFTVNGVTITAAEYGGGTLAEVVSAINDSDAGVTAVAVQVSPGNFRLQLSAEDSGGDGVFTVGGTGLTAGLGSFGIVSQGQNASITIGDGAAAYQVESATNTFTDVLPGLTFTAKKAGAVSITVTADAEKLADKVNDLVKAINAANKFIDDRQKYNASTGAVGVFVGSSLPQSLQNQLSNALIDPVSGSSLVGSSLGITTDRTGLITFDREKFLEAYEADPVAVEGFFTTNDADVDTDDGIAERFSVVAEQATALSTGRITAFIDGRREQIDNLDDDIAAWDDRLELKEIALRRKFSNLETILGSLQSQGNWLAGAISSLPQINR